MRIAPTILSVPLVFLGFAGCKGEPAPDGDRPGVIAPSGDASSSGGAGSQGGSSAAPAKGDRVLAEIGGVKVTESQVLPSLYDAYGLDVLLKVTQLALARDATAQAQITVSPADIEAERMLTLKLAFPDQKPEDYEELLGQLLTQQRVSRAEFKVVMETNAHLRALVREPSERDLTEEALRAEFNAIYGERVRVQHIALNNLQEVSEAQRRLKGAPAEAGKPEVKPEPFEKVARDMSVNRATGGEGGALPPFARTSPGYSREFIAAAFALKPGEVSSDVIQEGRFYHIIKAIDRLAPQAVKFEDVRDSVRQDLIRRRQNGMMGMRRAELAQRAIKELQINEPTLRDQFAARLAAANPKPAERDEVRRNLDEQRQRLNTPTTATTRTDAASPSAEPTAPTTSPTTTTAPTP